MDLKTEVESGLVSVIMMHSSYVAEVVNSSFEKESIFMLEVSQSVEQIRVLIYLYDGHFPPRMSNIFRNIKVEI